VDFFARQETARQRTWWLVVMFFLAIAGTIVSVYYAIGFIFQVGLSEDPESQREFGKLMWSAEALGMVSGVVSLIVLGGTAFKLAQLRSGGSKVAEMLGGTRINTTTAQPHERRLLNIVEEMAIASGVPVPPVYVMQGQMGINAFAAGYSIHDAVVGVTEGAMRGLKREELQGVIGHEFSHILNGDMRLNIRLIGIVFGLLVLALIGRVLIRLAASGRSRSGKKDGGAALFIALGLALMIVGYVGYFFGGLIKRAVSRQREYLADASAVQFTRNPLGLASALKKVGGITTGARVEHAHAEELSHMFFADGIKRFLGGGSLFATHPPLARRIKLLDPNFDGTFEPVTEQELFKNVQQVEAESDRKAQENKRSHDFITKIAVMDKTIAADPAAVLQKVGVLDELMLAQAGGLIESIPDELRAAVRDPLRAQSLLLALLVTSHSTEPSVDAWTWIPASYTELVGRFSDAVSRLTPRQRLALVDLSIPAIRSLSSDQAAKLVDLIDKVIRADNAVNLFEFAVLEIVRSGLREKLNVKVPLITLKKVDDIAAEAGLLLSVMALAGQSDEASAAAAFTRGVQSLGSISKSLQYKKPEVADLDQVKAALNTLIKATMPVRRQLLEASIACLSADGKISEPEVELFRAFAAALEIPVPPGAFGGDVAATGA